MSTGWNFRDVFGSGQTAQPDNGGMPCGACGGQGQQQWQSGCGSSGLLGTPAGLNAQPQSYGPGSYVPFYSAAGNYVGHGGATAQPTQFQGFASPQGGFTVSYTHLTLPTILLV